jgi:transcriptional regulator with XRE-family HTH domain
LYSGKEMITTKPGTANSYYIARKGAGLTQERSAELLHIAPRTLQDYESGRVRPKPPMVAAMSALYGVDLGVSDNPAAAYMNVFEHIDGLLDERRSMQRAVADGILTEDEGAIEFARRLFGLGVASMAAAQVPVYGIPGEKKTAPRSG